MVSPGTPIRRSSRPATAWSTHRRCGFFRPTALLAALSLWQISLRRWRADSRLHRHPLHVLCVRTRHARASPALAETRTLNPRPEAVRDEQFAIWCRSNTRWCGGCGSRVPRSPPRRPRSGLPAVVLRGRRAVVLCRGGPSLPGHHPLAEGLREPADVAHARLVKPGQDVRHYQVSSVTSARHRTPECGHARMHQPSVVDEALVT